jgi:hypothetical protein
MPPRRDTVPNSRKLTQSEETVIVQHILDLDARGFPPRLAAVADMANSLRAERHVGQVSVNWPRTFIKRQPELKVKFNRKYDYKRALCEDPEVIRGWFKLVENTKAKYGILDEDTYRGDRQLAHLGNLHAGNIKPLTYPNLHHDTTPPI